ncbi:Bud-site selection protein [Massarina eburnea CBS 473.64]|uniref:Bud-site selection protein n=1 Tax=Massarina eburnea CBS 473.64 TaxID=1395130 RepID=A0A6A6RX07_9PLEO|nr:Bud-site selection protein [Massarina eburnea CBS 473.64]
MPKRKRGESPAISPELTEPLSLPLKRQKKLCAQRIAAVQKPLLDALRHASYLERQKFSRRKKGAKSESNDKVTSRLEAEYVKLKSLDLAKVAEQHLRRIIARIKILRESEAIPESAKVVEKGDQDVALLNVQARLFKVDGVRTVVDEAIEDLKIIIGAGTGVVPVERGQEKDDGKKKKAKRDADEEAPEAEGDEYDSDALAAFNARIAAPSSADEDSDGSLSEGQRPPSIGDSESEDDADDLEDDSDSEDDEDASDSGALHDSDIDNDSDSDADSDSDEAPIPVPKAKRKVAPVATPKDSKFLPTLSQAAYFSGSESEASDLDTELTKRKNRRGQRARQKIWEKKYGGKAKHKQNEERSTGWDAKKGAVGDRRGKKEEKPKGFGPEKSGENAIPLGRTKPVTKRDDAGDLHPSWLAAKAAKEKKNAIKISTGGQSTAKKIVFD